ncbi:unnamed protein product [Effrenium voratum]|nr:unnamed protein product [Effrenium voratum]
MAPFDIDLPPGELQFKDLLSFVETYFTGEEFATQPRFVVDANCQDAALLIKVFEMIKELPRGKSLKEFPLTMVAINSDEERLISPKIQMCSKGVPHKVMTGDVNNPAGMLSGLKHRKIDAGKTLFLQVCRRELEEAAPLSPPTRSFAHGVLGGAEAEQLFASLVQQMQRSGQLAEGSLGICLVDIAPPPVAALAMAAAMAGLFPEVKRAQPFPLEECGQQMFTQLLTFKGYKVRFAVPEDLPALERLEEIAWKPHMRAPREGLLKRLETSPTTNFAVEVNGKVEAVLYTQRISTPQDVFKQKFQQVFAGHVPSGKVVQLIAINAHTEHRGLGTELRSFALHLARLDPLVDSVCAVTLCLDYATSGVRNLQQYVDQHVHGRVNDRILTFHTSYGAKVLGLVPGYRPEDKDNEGTGVLIQYKPKEWPYEPTLSINRLPERSRRKKIKEPQVPALDVLSGIMTEMGYEIDMDNLDQGFFASGLDSFDMGVIQNRLGRSLGKTLPATLMLDLPTVKELTEQLDRERGIGGPGSEGSDSASETASNASERREAARAEKPKQERRSERASDETITEWVRCWRQFLYEKTKDQRARSATPKRRSRSPGSAGKRERTDTPWDKLSTEELERIQMKLMWLLRLPQNQRRLQFVVDKGHDSEQSFLCDLRPALDSIMASQLLAMEMVQDTKPRTLQEAREDMESCALRLGGEAMQRHRELLGSLAHRVGAMPAQLAGVVAVAHRRERESTASRDGLKTPRSRGFGIRQRDAFLLSQLQHVEPFASRPAVSRIRKLREAKRPLEVGAIVQVDAEESFDAIVLSQSSSSAYLIADLETKTQEVVEEKWLRAYRPAQRGGDVPDFLGFARKPVVSESTKLQEYQKTGVNWLIHSFFNRCGGILADDMGLGKTLQTLTFLSYLQGAGVVRGPALVVVPLSCAGNWQREAKRFVPHLSVAKVCGSIKERQHSLDDNEIWYGMKDVIITTYETLCGTEDFFQRHHWSVLVLDEAHRIKNQGSKVREAGRSKKPET